MIPPFGHTGLLPPGIHSAIPDEFSARFGATIYRAYLLNGLYRAMLVLKDAGCRLVYIDGSFVSSKEVPGDFDVCWDTVGVNITRLRTLDPVLLDFSNGRILQKAKYGGEFFPAQMNNPDSGMVFLQFFQIDKDTGNPKGIVSIDIRGFSL